MNNDLLVRLNPPRKTDFGRVGLVLYIYGFLLLIAFLLGSNGLEGNYMHRFWWLTSIVAIHNIFELIALYRRNGGHFFLQPVVLGSIVLFLLQLGGISNYLMVTSDFEFVTLYNSKIERDPYWLVFAMSVVLAASVVYWMSFKLSAGKHFFNLYYKGYRKFYNYNVSVYSLITGWIVGCIIKLVINYYGGIGHRFIVLVQSHGEIPPLVSRLKVFENMSFLFLMMILFIAYQRGRNSLFTLILIIGTLFELTFAITSGARSPIIFLFLGFFLVDYYFRKKIKVVWIILFGIILYGAMTILAKYKSYVFDLKTRATEITNPMESIQLAIAFNQQIELTKDQRKAIQETARINAVGRFNYVNELAQMMHYKNIHGLDKNDPDFVTPFFTFPVFAVLPKFYLFNIAEPRYGYWVTKYLTGGRRTSTAISPVGFAYLAGGTGLVLFIFMILGILMRAAGYLLSNVSTVIGFILFIAIMQYLVLFDSVVPGAFINLIRFGLLLPPLLWLLLRK